MMFGVKKNSLQFVAHVNCLKKVNNSVGKSARKEISKANLLKSVVCGSEMTVLDQNMLHHSFSSCRESTLR